MTVALRSLATAQPAAMIEQTDAADMAVARCCRTDREAKLLGGLYRRSRVQRRAAVAISGNGNGGGKLDRDGSSSATESHDPWAFYPPSRFDDDRGPTTADRMRRYNDEAVPLAVRTSRAAIEQAGVSPSAIGHVVTASCTGFAAPGVDIRLVQQLGLPASVGRSHVGFMGCHGAFNALAVGKAMAEAKPGMKVLVCSVELCSLHFAYGFDPQRVVANALFADGSGAAVLEADGDADDWRLASTSSRLMPDSDAAMTWHIRDHGFEMTLSPRVPDLIRTHLRGWIAAWLAEHHLTIEQVGSWAIHPGGPRIVEAAEEALGLPVGTAGASRDVLRACGNMSSATILFILERLRRTGAPRPCVAMGFGPGLVGEAMLFL